MTPATTNDEAVELLAALARNLVFHDGMTMGDVQVILGATDRYRFQVFYKHDHDGPTFLESEPTLIEAVNKVAAQVLAATAQTES